MARRFIEPDRTEQMLLPEDTNEWIEDDDIVHLILAVVDKLDMRDVEESYRLGGAGRAPISPKTLLALLVYACCNGVSSTRAMERLCRRDAGYRYIVGRRIPDHTTISTFRKRNAELMRNLFLQVLRRCRQAGLAQLGMVALDGTKVEANASLKTGKTADTLEAEVDRMMSSLDRETTADNRRFGPTGSDTSVPKRVMRKLKKLERLEEAKRLAAEKDARRKAGKAKEKKAKANTTDPESRVMKAPGRWVQGCNARAVVSSDQIIVAADVSDAGNDVQQMSAMPGQARDNVEAAMEPSAALGAVAADAGYWSEANASLRHEGWDLLIASKKDRAQREALRDAPPPRGRCPNGMTEEQKMDRKLATKRGRHLCTLRGTTVEPVFGQMKCRQGAGRFSMRGLARCKGEWTLHAAVHNLRKLHRAAIEHREAAAKGGRSGLPVRERSRDLHSRLEIDSSCALL